MNQSIIPQTVLVTGAEGALGIEVVRRFLSAGCRVIATYYREASPAWERTDRLTSMKLDGAKSESVRQVFSSPELSTVDAWIHCAGGFRFAMTDQFSDEDLDFLIDANFRSAFLIARELLPKMKARDFGRIVFVSARATLQASGGMGPYAASKAAINMLTQSMADEVRGLNINVNAVLPTILDTPTNRKDMPKADFSTWVTIPQLAEVIFSLTQPVAQPIHGALIPVAGRV